MKDLLPLEDRSSHEVVVRIVGAVLGYGRQVVLRGVHLEIRPGEFWFFVGPNGSGKSTLLKTLLGLQRPLEGTVTLSPELEDHRAIGFVPQRCDAKPTLPQTVREFVRLGLARTGISGARARENVEWAVEKSGLSLLADRDYWALSGGQRQRTLIARGLVRRPRLLILDEPTNGLDLSSEESLTKLVLQLNRDLGITIIFVTHVMALALRYATHAALFFNGTAVTGRREDVLVPDHLRQAYGADISWFQQLSSAASP